MKDESNSAIKISKVLLGKPTSLLGFTFTNIGDLQKHGQHKSS